MARGCSILCDQARAISRFWRLMWSQHIPNLAWNKGREESLQRKSGGSEPADREVGAGQANILTVHYTY